MSRGSTWGEEEEIWSDDILKSQLEKNGENADPIEVFSDRMRERMCGDGKSNAT